MYIVSYPTKVNTEKIHPTRVNRKTHPSLSYQNHKKHHIQKHRKKDYTPLQTRSNTTSIPRQIRNSALFLSALSSPTVLPPQNRQKRKHPKSPPLASQVKKTETYQSSEDQSNNEGFMVNISQLEEVAPNKKLMQTHQKRHHKKKQRHQTTLNPPHATSPIIQ